MTMRVRMQLLALEHCWSISTGPPHYSPDLFPPPVYLPEELVWITALQQ
jgi:hypothetical protein